MKKLTCNQCGSTNVKINFLKKGFVLTDIDKTYSNLVVYVVCNRDTGPFMDYKVIVSIDGYISGCETLDEKSEVIRSFLPNLLENLTETHNLPFVPTLEGYLVINDCFKCKCNRCGNRWIQKNVKSQSEKRNTRSKKRPPNKNKHARVQAKQSQHQKPRQPNRVHEAEIVKEEGFITKLIRTILDK